MLASGANAMLTDIEQGPGLGFLRYLIKPINVKEFMEALDVALVFAGPYPGAAAEEAPSR